MQFLITLLTAALVAFSCPSRAADEPQQLKQARTAYQKEVETVSRPARDKYVRALNDLKRALTAKGDLEGALAVQHELERVSANSVFPRFVGDWSVIYANGSVRHYSILADGRVTWTDSNPPKQATLTQKTDDYLLDFGDGKLEKLTPSANAFRLEHYDPGTKFLRGDAGVPATPGRAK